MKPAADAFSAPRLASNPAAATLWQLDAARGAAACYIVAGHLCRDELGAAVPGLRFLLGFGQEAVIAFFLLSGFVIHWSTEHKPGLRFGEYVKARAVRIYPLFLLTLLLTFVIAHLRSPVDPRASLGNLLGNVAMLQDWSGVKPGVWVEVYAGVLVLWSLSYEWWFYLLYYPISRRLPPGRQVWVVALVSLGQAAVYLFYPNQASRFLLYFCIWWTGVELARAKLGGRPMNLRTFGPSLGTLVLVAALLGSGAWQEARAGEVLRAGTHPVLELRHFIAALGLVTGALLWHRLRWAGFRLLFGGFIRVAPWSYALYLLHEPLALHAAPFRFVDFAWLRVLLNVAFVCGVAWLAETHFQRWCRRIFLR